MRSSLNLKYLGIGVKKIVEEEQMIKLLESLEKDFFEIQQFKIINPEGMLVKNFKCFIASIISTHRNYMHGPCDYGVFFTLDGTGKICGFQIREGSIKYSLLEAYYLLVQYRFDTEKRERNCIHLCETNYNKIYTNLYCTFSAKRFVGYGNANSMTDCEKYEYNREIRIKGRNDSDPKTLSELLKELFRIRLEFPEWRTYCPRFHISKTA